MSEPNKDTVQYYARKYDFHRILTHLLASRETEWPAIIAQHPVTKSDAFITYLRNNRKEIKAGLDKVADTSNKIKRAFCYTCRPAQTLN